MWLHWGVWLNSWVFVYKLSGCGFEYRYSHLNFRYRSCFKQGVLEILATREFRFTLKRIRDLINNMQCISHKRHKLQFVVLYYGNVKRLKKKLYYKLKKFFSVVSLAFLRLSITLVGAFIFFGERKIHCSVRWDKLVITYHYFFNYYITFTFYFVSIK